MLVIALLEGEHKVRPYIVAETMIKADLYTNQQEKELKEAKIR